EDGSSRGVQPSKRRISRRTILVGLAGLAVASSGITWLALSQRSHISSTTPTPIPVGTTLLIYRGHSDTTNGVAWSTDNKRIASASNDKTVQVWDASTGELFRVYHGHRDLVTQVSWSPDGKYIASA